LLPVFSLRRQSPPVLIPPFCISSGSFVCCPDRFPPPHTGFFHASCLVEFVVSPKKRVGSKSQLGTLEGWLSTPPSPCSSHVDFFNLTVWIRVLVVHTAPAFWCVPCAVDILFFLFFPFFSFDPIMVPARNPFFEGQASPFLAGDFFFDSAPSVVIVSNLVAVSSPFLFLQLVFHPGPPPPCLCLTLLIFPGELPFTDENLMFPFPVDFSSGLCPYPPRVLRDPGEFSLQRTPGSGCSDWAPLSL